jgi:hypothetical protein
VLGGAAAAFILSLIPSYVTASYSSPILGSGSIGVSAWHSYAPLGLVMLFAAAVIVALRVFAVTTLPEIGVGWALITTALAGLGTLLIILRALTASESVSFAGVSASSGPGWSGYLLMLLAIATTVFAALNFRESGEKAPRDARESSGAAATPPSAPPPNAPPSSGPPPTVPPA